MLLASRQNDAACFVMLQYATPNLDCPWWLQQRHPWLCWFRVPCRAACLPDTALKAWDLPHGITYANRLSSTLVAQLT